METLEYKSKIHEAFSEVRAFSFKEKKTAFMDEEATNQILDAILDFKTNVSNKAEEISCLSERIETITWLNDIDEESLMVLNDLISSAKDAYSSLVRQYLILNKLKSKGIAKEEIKNFKYSIDELKESYEDLESVFFSLPAMPEFVETTRQLSLV